MSAGVVCLEPTDYVERIQAGLREMCSPYKYGPLGMHAAIAAYRRTAYHTEVCTLDTRWRVCE